jgi:RecA/RadA recombinase
VEEQRGAGVDSPMMICWDSVAASVPAKMLEEDDSGKAHVAVEAKLNNKNIRKLKGLMVKTQVCCVFINHYYMTQPMSMYEQPELVIKGGEEMEFLTTLVIRTKKGKKLERVVKSEKQKIGRVTRFEIHKGHFHGRTIVKDVFVVDKGILESKEDLEEYQKGLRGVL